MLPNGVLLPNAVTPRRAGPRFTFLYVGTLGYFPNQDAVEHFCGAILPIIRRQAPTSLRVLVVGTGVPPAVQRLSHIPEVQVVGAVPDVAPWYEEADAAIIPLRAGGGTRIKALEAFAHRRPVVSTALGVEGLDVCHGQHVLLGDTPEAFAEQCLRLMRDPSLGDSLVEAAYDLVTARYSANAVARTIAALSMT